MNIKILHYENQTENNLPETSAPETNTSETNTTKNSPYEIAFENNVLRLHVNIFFRGKYRQEYINIDVTTLDHKAVEIAIRENSSTIALSMYEIFNYVNRDTGLSQPQLNGKKLARIITDNTTCYVLLFIPCEDIDGFDNEIIDTELTATGVLATKVPWFNERVNNIKRKALMINNVDCYRSLGYLEAQVDLLTRIVLSIVDDSELVRILKDADKNSVLNIKPLEDIKQEFVENKNTLRMLQEDYYGRIKAE